MIRSQHITLELALQRHRDLVDAGAALGSRQAAAEPVEHRDVLVVVRGERSGLVAGADGGAEPTAGRPEQALRARRIGAGRRFEREEPRDHRGSGGPGARKREPVR